MKIRKLTALLLSAVVMCSACADNDAEITTTVTENVITEESTSAEPSGTNPEYEVVDGTVIFSEGITEIPSGIFYSREKFTKISPCGAMDSRLRGNDEDESMGPDTGMTTLR